MTDALSASTAHLMLLPVLLPLLAAAALLWLGERRRRIGAWVNVLACVLNLGVALWLLLWIDAGAAGAGTGASAAALAVYLPGNWPVPIGIQLVADRLAALMLLLTALVALACVLFAVARWQRAGVYFHPLWQVQLLGLNGAFLTGDLFNLFVFFEVLLAASYGLALHGSGRARVAAGLHYLVVNLIAAFLFLLAVAMIYRATGTLGMAELARLIAVLPPERQPLLHTGVALLAVAFLTKAACWPLNFWLLPMYAAASPPVAGLFVLLSKVGVYALLRLWTLWFPASAADSVPPFGAGVLVWAGLLTLAFGTVGTLAAQTTTRVAAFSLIVSSGTLLAAIGFARNGLTAAALLYLVVSTLAASALFLLSELIDRSRLIAAADAHDAAGRAPVPRAAFDPPRLALAAHAQQASAEPETAPSEDDLPEPVGRPIRAAIAFLGFSFMACAILLAGLPPLAGFLSKFGLIGATLGSAGGQLRAGAAPGIAVGGAAWTYVALLALSGAGALLALSRIGIRAFWAPQQRPKPHLRLIEVVPVAGLLAVCLALGLWPEPALRYLGATAAQLHQPAQYVQAVGAAAVRLVPGAYRP